MVDFKELLKKKKIDLCSHGINRKFCGACKPKKQKKIKFEGAQLSADQVEAVNAIMTERGPFFLTGQAGSGKSFVVRYIKEQIGDDCITCAMTGVAAQLIDSRTAHSFLGIIPVDEWLRKKRQAEGQPNPAYCLKIPKMSVKTGKLQKDWPNINVAKSRMIIIDEISMASSEFIIRISERFRKACGDNKDYWPKLVLVGDLLQLPPTEGERIFANSGFDKFRVIQLKQQHRQTEEADKLFLEALNEIRVGVLSDTAKKLLIERVVSDLPIGCTHLHAKNENVDETNRRRLAELPTAEVKIPWEVELNEDLDPEEDIEKINIALDYSRSKDSPKLVEYLTLKEGARILLLTNDNAGRWVNGSTGEIVKIEDEFVTVRLDRKSELVDVPRAEEDLLYGWTQIGVIRQFPMKLAWAMTIHKCVSGSTLIPTADGIKQISSLADGIACGKFAERKITVHGIDGWKETDQVYHGKIEKSIKIKTRQGYEIEGSSRHPILIAENGKFVWKKLPEIKIGDIAVIRSGTFAAGRSNHSPNMAWLMGMIIGDGNCTDKKEGRIEVTNADYDTLDEIKRIVQKEIGSPVIIRKLKSKAKGAYFHGVRARRRLLKFGLFYNCSPQKSIPASIWKSSSRVQYSFLQGLFDSDGGVNKTSVHFTTTSKQLAFEVQLLLLNLGIISKRSEMVKPRNGNYIPWRVYVCGRNAFKFVNEIGFRCVRKNKLAIAKYGLQKTNIPKSNIGSIPNGRKMAAALRESLRTSQEYFDRSKRPLHQLLSRVIAGKVNLSIYHLPYIANLIDLKYHSSDLYHIYKDMLFFDKITSIKTGRAEMYDIHVPDGHDFIGNGFVNHNSQGMTLDKVGVNLSDHFDCGMTYVALSRCRYLDGLFLCGRMPEEIDVDHQALDFLKRHEKS